MTSMDLSATAAFKDLCLDVVDATVQARFWSALLGLEIAGRGADLRLVGATPEQTVWINVVPEPHTVKNRVHLDVHGTSVEWAEALGARVVEPHAEWTVMSDPEGGEFCLFRRDSLPAYRLYEIVVDCAEPAQLAGWWAGIFGARLGHDDGDAWWWIDQITGSPFESLVFVPVPERKSVKNRVHWDVTIDRLDDLTDAGAVLLRAQDQEIDWNVMADPEGNEFCAFVVSG